MVQAVSFTFPMRFDVSRREMKGGPSPPTIACQPIAHGRFCVHGAGAASQAPVIAARRWLRNASTYRGVASVRTAPRSVRRVLFVATIFGDSLETPPDGSITLMRSSSWR